MTAYARADISNGCVGGRFRIKEVGREIRFGIGVVVIVVHLRLRSFPTVRNQEKSNIQSRFKRRGVVDVNGVAKA